MLDEQTHAIRRILTDEDIQKYAGEGFWDLIQSVISADPIAKISAAKDIKEIIFHIPTLLFWDKMKRYLMGTFSNYEDQIKMAAKFCHDNEKYSDFIKKQIHLINEIDDDKKIDYFAALTRCFLMTPLTEELFFKLSKFIVICTSDELQFLRSKPFTYMNKNIAIISSLYQYGLFVQGDHYKDGDVLYELSDYGKALKQNSLNFDEGLNGTERITSYDMIAPLNILEAADDEEVDKMLASVFDS